MIKRIVMPAAGQTTDAATVVTIRAAVGDKVKRGDELLEVETDKATLPIESVASGYVLRIFVKEYDTIDAGTLLMEIGDEDDLAAAADPVESPVQAEEEEPQAEPEAAPTVTEEIKPAEPEPVRY
ncbi:MAG: pyruvate dehydrogenase complex dihydrolipoyllysine-residue acetyltransferase, partial [Clostridia bacterium]|nr:pyruvate dehydrogenase complex dihydrolipoyllysine-residue acetyltransferase [Clostridia bacterium]